MNTLLVVTDVTTAIAIVLLMLQINQLRRQLKEQRRLGYKAHQQITDLQDRLASYKEWAGAHEKWAVSSTEAITQITEILGKVVDR